MLGTVLVAAVFAPEGSTRARQQTPRIGWAENLELRNDSFLPTSAAAREQLALGDQAWVALEDAGSAFDNGRVPREAVEAFEAWHAALAQSGEGENVPKRVFPPEKDAPAVPADELRSSESVAYAVLRRLRALSPAQRLAFRERFEGLARTALGGARLSWPPSEAFARIEREHPITEPAARVALALCEVELEAGRAGLASTWLERAATHVELGGLDAERWEPALQRRRDAVRSLAQDSRDLSTTAEPWTRANELELIETYSFFEAGPGRVGGPTRSSRGLALAGVRPGLRPGVVFLDDGRLVVQTGDAIVTLSEEDPLPVTLLASEILVSLCGWRFEGPRGGPGGEWITLPASDGNSIVVVAGYGDALVCLEPPTPGEPATVRWAVSEEGSYRPPSSDTAVQPRELEPLLPIAAWDFQPGPLVHEDRVYVQARQWTQSGDGPSRRVGQPRAMLLAFDLAHGDLVWSRELGIGSDVRIGPQDRQAQATFGLPALPLVEAGGRVFAGTQLGIGSVIDLSDGRLVWSFKNRRRTPQGAGWSPATIPPLAEPCPGGQEAGGGPVVLWGPADSDFLYWLRMEPGLAPTSLQVRPPEPIAGGRELLAGTSCDVLVSGRSGARAALARWTPRTGQRSTALLLRREEAFTGAALASDERVFVPTDKGLYVLDRTRDLYLLQQLPLVSLRPARGTAAGVLGGTVAARGDRIAVVGRGDLWWFRVAR